jgi:Cdc6-like AAA superfamily ATPase
VLKGNQASLFVYGQTGTGKTYTMGTLEAIKREDQGLIPLALNYLINQLKESRADKDWKLSLSFMQIYMDDILDLLNPSSGKLKIREDHEYAETYV